MRERVSEMNEVDREMCNYLVNSCKKKKKKLENAAFPRFFKATAEV